MEMIWAVLALVVLALGGLLTTVVVSSHVQRRNAEKRRKMEILVTGRGRTDASPRLQGATPQQPANVANATKPTAWPFVNRRAHEAREMAKLIQEIDDIRASLERGKAKTAKQTQEDAMVRRAERLHRELVKEVERENRRGEPKSRPSGPCNLLINYVDAEGVMTSRKVAPYKTGNTNERFDAWCELREDRRTFFFSRVQSGMNMLTRQPLDRAGVFKYVHPDRRVPEELRR